MEKLCGRLTDDDIIRCAVYACYVFDPQRSFWKYYKIFWVLGLGKKNVHTNAEWWRIIPAPHSSWHTGDM